MLKRSLIAAVVVVLSVAPLFAGGVDPDNLKEYGKGIIKDYSDMKEMDEIEWAWIAPQVKLSGYQFNVKSFENLSTIGDDDMEETMNEDLPKTLKRVAAKDGSVLQVESAIYWAQRANRGKAWIPYAGGHLAQAGAGVELVFRNSKDEIVAKIRHSGRQGEQLEDAVEELIDDIAQFIKTH